MFLSQAHAPRHMLTFLGYLVFMATTNSRRVWVYVLLYVYVVYGFIYLNGLVDALNPTYGYIHSPSNAVHHAFPSTGVCLHVELHCYSNPNQYTHFARRSTPGGALDIQRVLGEHGSTHQFSLLAH